MLQILLSATGASDKENRGGSTKGRAGSVPPRTTTPNSAPGKGTVTPAVRPASSMGLGAGRSQSVPSKRRRLVETNVAPQVPGFVPRSASGASAGAGHNHPPPPSRIAMPVPVRATATATTVNGGVPVLHVTRAVSATTMPTRRQQAALGIGRPPSREPMALRAATTGSYHARSVSSGSTSSLRNPQTIALKAKRARRESFRPRPSGDWKPPLSQGRYGGLEEDALKEEDEDT